MKEAVEKFISVMEQTGAVTAELQCQMLHPKGNVYAQEDTELYQEVVFKLC